MKKTSATAKNKALVAAFEKRLAKPIRVSRYCHLTGALGTALMLADRALAATTFRGLDLYRLQIPLRSEICELCTNHCKLTVARLDDSEVAYGFLCGRDYDTRQFVNNNRTGFDLLKARAKIYACPTAREIKADYVIGIPAALYLLEELPFWQFFFNALGIKTDTSKSCRTALKDGKRQAGAEFCAPMAALHGHVGYLLDRCDFVFLPFYLDKKGREKGPRRQYCYYSQFAPGLSSFIDGVDRKKFLMPVADYLYSSFHTKAQLYSMLRSISGQRISYFDVSAAYDQAREFMNSCHFDWQGVYQEHTVRSDELHVVLLGRPYAILSAAMHKGIPDILASLGTKTFFQDMLSYSPQDVESIEPLLKELHWHYAAKILEAAEVTAQTPGAYPILMTAFKCAPDSFVIDYFKLIMEAHGKPYLILQLDEHDATGGYETRIESALGAFQNHFAAQQSGLPDIEPSVPWPSHCRDLTGKTVIIPNWDPISCPLVVASLRRAGIDADCLVETSDRIQRSMRHNSGQCIPLNIVAQEFIDHIEEHGLDPSRAVFWFAEGEIACNLKMIPHHIKYILNSYGNGMEQAEVYVGPISMIDISITLPVHIYFAYMFGGMIRKMGCRIRPYERFQGETDRVIAEAVDILADAFAGERSRETAVAEVVSRFEQIETVKVRDAQSRPKVAIFGDLYARDNPVFNQGLVHFIEAHGGEVLTTPYSDYLKMISRPYFRKWLIEGHYMSVISSKALMTTLKMKEKTYYKHFERILKEPEAEFDESAKDILARYSLRLENTGESMDNLLKIHYVIKHHPDVALFVQTTPAFCCPSLVTEAMAAQIEQKTGVPIVSITYDGTGGNKNEAIIPYLKFPRRTYGRRATGDLRISR
jgi:predicted nucleotide-binding protein (sugar kinase/HSP70/actin superfamily)